MSSPKKSLKHKLDNALLSVSSAKKLKTSKLNDSGLGSSMSTKKKSTKERSKKLPSKAKRQLSIEKPSEPVDVGALDVSQLLSLGEGSHSESIAAALSDSTSDSDQSDWEEVVSPDKEPVIPAEGVDITIENPLISFKRKKKEFDIHDEVRKQLKRRQKEIQILKHKVHILCWIAHIKSLNSTLNSEVLLSRTLTLIKSKALYPPKHADLKYLERIVAWYRKEINLKESAMDDKCKEGLESELSHQLEKKLAVKKTHFVFMFVIVLRALGLQTRLITSIVVVPLKPESTKVASTKNEATTSQGPSSSAKDAQKSDTKTDDKKASEGSKNKKTLVTSAKSTVAKNVNESQQKTNKTEKQESRRKAAKMFNNDSSDEEEFSKHFRVAPAKKSRLEGSATQSTSSKNLSKDSTQSNISSNKTGKIPAKNKLKVKEEKDKETSRHFAKTSNVGSSKSSASKSSATRKTVKKETNSDDDFSPPSPQSNINSNKITKVAAKNKLKVKEEKDGETSRHFAKTANSVGTSKSAASKCSTTSKTVKKETNSDDDFSPPRKNLVKKAQPVDRKVLSSDDESKLGKKKVGQNYWVEVFLEAEEKWISVDVIGGKIHCVKRLYSKATQPVAYVLASNNDLTIKDVTKRYVPNWHSDTRKRRVEADWWEQTIWPYLPASSAREREEDEDIASQLHDMPLPKAISEYKFHPLYALQRHLLKFEGIYPPDAPPLGYIRKEPVFARECVVTLRSRDIWFKEARIVRKNETPYKIVKSRPKYDKMSGDWKRDLPLELFGVWQTEDYVPPNAEDGKVPRNEYGNVDLFKPCMLPGGTVHLQIPALSRVAKKLGIDCAPAIVGFEFHSGGSHPVQDGFVVCEEFKDTLLDAWNAEIDESARRAEEKRDKRVYGNWRRLIRGLLIRENLKLKYAFGEHSDEEATPSTSVKKPIIKKLKKK